MVAFALAVPTPASAAFPDGAGRITVSDSNGATHSVWPDGTHKASEFFVSSLPYTTVGFWSGGGQKVTVFDPADNQSVSVFDDGVNVASTVNGLNGELIVGAALSPDTNRLATSSDQGVVIRNGGVASTIYPNASGRLGWSAEGTDGTIVWDGYPTGEGDPGMGIPGGEGPSFPPAASESNNAGIFVSIQGGAPVEIVTDENADNPSISQDGKILAYASLGDIYYLDLSQQNPTPVKLPGSTLGTDSMPAVSPDGKQIVFQGGSALMVADVAGGVARKVEDMAANTDVIGLAWQPSMKVNGGTAAVSGTAKVGETLSITGDAPFGGSPLTTTYQWQRCTDLPPESDGCVDIPGATASTYTLTADDKGYQVRVKRTATNPTGTQTVTSANTATVTDAGGNDPDPIPVDSIKPEQPVFSNGPDSLDTDTTPTFEWDGAEQGGKFQCQIVGDLAVGEETATPWADCTSPFTTPELAVGAHSFRVRQVDDANNVGDYRQYDWTITAPQGPNNPPDTTKPLKPTVTVSPAQLDNDPTPTFEWTGAEQGGKFQCRIVEGLPESDDISSWTDCTSPYTVPSALTEGYYTFLVRQVDDAGNLGDTAYVAWELDTTAPDEVVLLETPMLTTPETTATFKFQNGGKSGRLECRVDAAPDEIDQSKWHECGSPVVLANLAPGKHKFEVREVDDAGNASVPAVWNWVVKPVVIEQPQPETPKPEEPKPETPKPETPAPAVETPATPATPAVTPATPAAVETPKPATTKVTPKAPALVATIGGTKTGAQVGANGGTSSAATIEVAKESVGVGCSITGTVLKSCKVDLYADVAGGTTARAAAVKQVLVGTGTYESKNGSDKMDVRIELNATGKAMLRKNPAGLKVTVKISGKPVAGPALKASGKAVLKTDRASMTVGGFAVNSAVLTKKAKAELRAFAKFGKAGSVRCVGHTDGSTDDESYLKGLGERRAKAVCGFLAKVGVKAGKRTLVSKADTVPAATNTTKAGRAQNRRVVVTLVR